MPENTVDELLACDASIPVHVHLLPTSVGYLILTDAKFSNMQMILTGGSRS